MNSTVYRLADRALGGTLADRLRAYADAGVSRRAASRLLAQDLGVEIDSQTIDRWMRQVAEAS